MVIPCIKFCASYNAFGNFYEADESLKILCLRTFKKRCALIIALICSNIFLFSLVLRYSYQKLFFKHHKIFLTGVCYNGGLFAHCDASSLVLSEGNSLN